MFHIVYDDEIKCDIRTQSGLVNSLRESFVEGKCTYGILSSYEGQFIQTARERDKYIIELGNPIAKLVFRRRNDKKDRFIKGKMTINTNGGNMIVNKSDIHSFDQVVSEFVKFMNGDIDLEDNWVEYIDIP